MRQNKIGGLKFDASSEKYDASQQGLSEAIFYFLPYKLNFIAIGYRKELCMFNSYHLTKQFKKLESAVCVSFFVFYEGKFYSELFWFSHINLCN